MTPLLKQSQEPDPSITSPFLGEGQVFVAAISGVNGHLIRRTVEHSLENQDLRQAFILVDFVAVNDNRPDGNGFKLGRFRGNESSEWLLERYCSLISIEMFKNSMTILWQSLSGREGVVVQDMASADPGKIPARQELIERNKQELLAFWRLRLSEFYRSDLYGEHESTEAMFAHLEIAVKKLHERGVKTVLVTPAVHATLAELMRRMGVWGRYEAFVLRLASLGSRYGYDTWTFSPYHPMATQDPRSVDYRTEKNTTLPGYMDPGHSNWPMGHIILGIVFGKGSSAIVDFGFKVSPDTADGVFEIIHRQREKFMANSRDLDALIPERPIWALKSGLEPDRTEGIAGEG